MKIFATAVILSGCEESSLNGCKDKSIYRLFELDSSHSFRMTAVDNLIFTVSNDRDGKLLALGLKLI